MVLAAAPIWVFLFVVVPQSTGYGAFPIRLIVAPIVLTGLTLAFQRLLRPREDAWALAFFFAAAVAMITLLVAAFASS